MKELVCLSQGQGRQQNVMKATENCLMARSISNKLALVLTWNSEAKMEIQDESSEV